MKAHFEAMAAYRLSLGAPDLPTVASVSEPTDEWDGRVRCIDCRALRGISCARPKEAGLRSTNPVGAELSPSFRTMRQRCPGHLPRKSDEGSAPCRG